MTEVLCLANSRKEHERCVAGIDLTTGKFVRPVSNTESQAIPEEWTFVGSSHLKPLDIVDIPMQNGDASVPFQAENRYCSEGWKKIGKKEPEEIRKYCESDRTILHSNKIKTIPERYFKLKKVPRKHWKSLQLIAVSNAKFHQKKPGKWNSVFTTKNREEHELRVTDPDFTEKLAQGYRPREENEFIMLLSLTRPWKHPKVARTKPRKCYKLVAGVIEVK